MLHEWFDSVTLISSCYAFAWWNKQSRISTLENVILLAVVSVQERSFTELFSFKSSLSERICLLWNNANLDLPAWESRVRLAYLK